jgi:ribosomal-protein-alanine N-acetyltransferase
MNKPPNRPIETERLLLQPYALNYSASFFELIQDNRAILAESFPLLLSSTATIPDTKDFIQQRIFDWNKNKAFGFFFFLKEKEPLIGYLNIKDIDWKTAKGEIAYFIDRDYYQQGLATEALRELLHICFEELELSHVQARVSTINIPSIKLLEKVGLQYEGTFHKDFITYHKEAIDTYRYGISKESYERIRR